MSNEPFVTDVKTLRQRARQHIEEGAVTASYGGDTAAAIKVLNDALATEIVCVLRYKRHYFMYGASPSFSSISTTRTSAMPGSACF